MLKLKQCSHIVAGTIVDLDSTRANTDITKYLESAENPEKKRKGNLPAMQSVEKQADSLEEAWW